MARAVAVSGTLVALAVDANDGLLLLDASDASEPVLRAEVETPDTPFALKIQDGILVGTYHAEGGKVFDVSDCL